MLSSSVAPSGRSATRKIHHDLPAAARSLRDGLLVLLLAALLLLGSGFVTAAQAAPLNAQDYGATGDGVTDDWQALTDGMQAAAAAGQPLFVPAGDYYLSRELSPPDGLVIEGAGPSRTTLFLKEESGGSLRFIFHRSNPERVTIRDMRLRGAGYTGRQSGLYLYGARNCTLQNLAFENCWYGMKLGDAYRPASGWTVRSITAVRCRMPMYIQDVQDSTFTGLSLQGMQVDGGLDHCIYMSEGCYRLTFTDVTLTGGGGYGLHLYSGGGGTSSDIAFTDLTIQAARQPMCICDGFSDIRIRNLRSTMTINEVQLRVSGCTDVLIDGFSATGGYAFLGTWSGDRAGTITLRNGTYDGNNVLSPHADEQGIATLLLENVSLGSGAAVTTTTRPPTTTTVTTVPPTTATTAAPTTTTVTTVPPTTRPPTTGRPSGPAPQVTAAPLRPFSDVGASHPYLSEITLLAEQGIVEGLPDGSFRPDEPVTRQQFAKMIVLTLGLRVTEQDRCPFADVACPPDDLYPDNYVAVAARYGITQGLADGSFAPATSITRAQVISMVVRAAGRQHPGLLATPPAAYLTPWGPFSPDHQDNVRVAATNGLLDGISLEDLSPWQGMTRGEAAQMLANLAGLLTG